MSPLPTPQDCQGVHWYVSQSTKSSLKQSSRRLYGRTTLRFFRGQSGVQPRRRNTGISNLSRKTRDFRGRIQPRLSQSPETHSPVISSGFTSSMKWKSIQIVRFLSDEETNSKAGVKARHSPQCPCSLRRSSQISSKSCAKLYSRE